MNNSSYRFCMKKTHTHIKNDKTFDVNQWSIYIETKINACLRIFYRKQRKITLCQK